MTTYEQYIKSYNDRVEREQQLVNQYNQRPEQLQNRFLWTVTSVERHSKTRNEIEVLKIIAGVLLAGAVLVVSIMI